MPTQSDAMSRPFILNSDVNAGTRGMPASHLCRVLVVDDDPLVRARLSALLNSAQYQVEVAATGEDALRIMDAVHCHILLTDWHMPDMDGLALCRRVRLESHDHYVYVLMLTIRDTELDMLTGLAAGADDYLVKSAPIEEILARLEIGRRISYTDSAGQTRNRGDWASSHCDPVTGAHSLAYLLQHLPRELARSQRYGHTLGVLHCRIDGFSGFVDRFGPAAGDEQLRSFVIGVEASIRRCDWLARAGGESFMIVLPETTAAGARVAAQKVRGLFALHPFATPAEPIGFTVSVEAAAVNGKQDADAGGQIDSLLLAARAVTPGAGRFGPN